MRESFSRYVDYKTTHFFCKKHFNKQHEAGDI